MKGDIYHNGEGIADQTAGYALRQVQIQENRVQAIKMLTKMQELAKKHGWYFHGDLVLTNRKTKLYAKLYNI